MLSVGMNRNSDAKTEEPTNKDDNIHDDSHFDRFFCIFAASKATKTPQRRPGNLKTFGIEKSTWIVSAGVIKGDNIYAFHGASKKITQNSISQPI